MRIAVDARELGLRPRGVGRFLGEVLACWRADASFQHRVVLIAPERSAALEEAASGPSSELLVTGQGRLRSGTWWEQTVLPRAARAARADVLFGPGYSLPIGCPVPGVVAVHDVSFEAHPEWFSLREGVRRRLLTRWSVARAARVITGSRFAADELSRHYGLRRERVVVAPYGVSPRFRPSAAAEVEAAAARFGLTGNLVVLSVGTLLERRHPATLLAAFASVQRRHPRARLLVIGEDRQRPRSASLLQLAARFELGRTLCWHEDVSEESLPALYSLARVVVYLSSYEGFGLPTLEALACGAPVVGSRVPALTESPPPGATLVDPTSVSEVAAALDRHLAGAEQPGAGNPIAPLAAAGWGDTAQAVLGALVEAA